MDAVVLGFPHKGGAYPENGPGEMAVALVQSLEDHGGKCLVRAPVKQILLDEAGRAIGVEMTEENGSVRILAKHCVVSACGWRNTRRLCRGSAFHDELNLPQGEGFCMANIGLRGTAAELGLECANMELLPAGKGLSVFEGVRNYLDDPFGVPPMEIPAMITFPSVKDRAYKLKKQIKDGRETVQLLTIARCEWFDKDFVPDQGISTLAWQAPTRSDEYREKKQKFLDRLLQILFTVYPQLKDKVELADLATPNTIEHYLPTGSGSAIGLDVNGGEGCRFTDMSTMKKLDMKTPVPGLWMTGQDTLLCGVPMAQAAGLIAALRIAGPVGASRLVWRSAWLLLSHLGERSRNSVSSQA